jgi:hypothetical protein
MENETDGGGDVDHDVDRETQRDGQSHHVELENVVESDPESVNDLDRVRCDHQSDPESVNDLDRGRCDHHAVLVRAMGIDVDSHLECFQSCDP